MMSWTFTAPPPARVLPNRVPRSRPEHAHRPGERLRTPLAAPTLDGMARPNEEVAALLQEYADLISITGGDAYKTRAYEKAARAVGGHHADVSRLDLKGLQGIPNVGKSIAEKIGEYL